MESSKDIQELSAIYMRDVAEALNPKLQAIDDKSKADVAKRAAAAAAEKEKSAKSASDFQAHKKAVLAKGGRPVDALDSWHKKKLNKEENEIEEKVLTPGQKLAKMEKDDAAFGAPNVKTRKVSDQEPSQKARDRNGKWHEQVATLRGLVEKTKQKDTPDQVKAVIAYDKARKGTDDATYDSEHGDEEQAKKERDYAKWQRDQGAEDAQKSGHPWEHAKGSTREKEGKKSVKHAHIKDSYKPLSNKDKQGLSDAYLSIYGEDKDWGYDKDGNSLNPVDIEKRKKKEDDLFGSPNKKKKSVKEESQAKQEIADLKKGAKTLKGKWIAKADKVEEDKNWIQKAVKRPGAFTAKANKHDMGVQQFAKYVDDNPKKFDTRTKRQANLAQTFASMKKEDMDEMIEIIGEVLLEG